MAKKIIFKRNVGKQLTREQQNTVLDLMDIAQKVAKQKAPLGKQKGLDVEDLQQEAYLGICELVLRWNGKSMKQLKKDAEWVSLQYVQYLIKGEQTQDNHVDPYLDACNLIHVCDETHDERLQTVEHNEANYLKVEAMLGQLNGVERKVVRMTYGIHCKVHDYGEIAMTMGLKKNRVREIYETAMGKMEFGEK